LNRTASAARRVGQGDQVNGLEALLKNQKSFWRFVGIVTVIVLILTVLALVLGVGAALLTGLNSVRA
jgi:ABC-type sugar transport system permease subunit